MAGGGAGQAEGVVAGARLCGVSSGRPPGILGVPEEVKSCQPSDNVQSGDPQGVIMVPEGAGQLAIVIEIIVIIIPDLPIYPDAAGENTNPPDSRRC